MFLNIVRNETHVGQFAVVLYARSSDGRHQVAAEEAEVGVAVNPPQRAHKARGVQVAACFADNEIILHCFNS